jgi:hypothetical protein
MCQIQRSTFRCGHATEAVVPCPAKMSEVPDDSRKGSGASDNCSSNDNGDNANGGSGGDGGDEGGVACMVTHTYPRERVVCYQCRAAATFVAPGPGQGPAGGAARYPMGARHDERLLRRFRDMEL